MSFHARARPTECFPVPQTSGQRPGERGGCAAYASFRIQHEKGPRADLAAVSVSTRDTASSPFVPLVVDGASKDICVLRTSASRIPGGGGPPTTRGSHPYRKRSARSPIMLNIDLVHGPSALILRRAEAPGSLSWRDEGNNKARHGPVNGMRRTLCPGAGYGMTCMRIQIAPALPDARGARLIETAACTVGLVPNKDAMGGGMPPSPTVEF